MGVFIPGCSRRRPRGVVNKYLDRQGVIDHVAAVVLIMLVRLAFTVRPLARASRVYCPGFFGVSHSSFQRRHACRRTGSRNSASAQVCPPSMLTAIPVTSVSPAHAAPETV